MLSLSSRSRVFLAIGFGSLLASCATFRAPTSVEGTIPFVIDNQTNEPLCTFAMAPATEASAGEDWTGAAAIAAHTSRAVQVKPDTYRVMIEGCGTGLHGDADKVSVTRATHLEITTDDHRSAPPEGYEGAIVTAHRGS